jgi:hypothetical protein
MLYSSFTVLDHKTVSFAYIFFTHETCNCDEQVIATAYNDCNLTKKVANQS